MKITIRISKKYYMFVYDKVREAVMEECGGALLRSTTAGLMIYKTRKIRGELKLFHIILQTEKLSK